MVPLWVTCWRPHKTSTAWGEASNTRTTKRPVSNNPWERSGAAMMLIMLRCSRKIAHTNRILSNDPWRSREAPWRRNGDGNDVDDAGSSPAQSMQLSTAAAQVHMVECMLLLHDSGGIVTKVLFCQEEGQNPSRANPFPRRCTNLATSSNLHVLKRGKTKHPCNPMLPAGGSYY